MHLNFLDRDKLRSWVHLHRDDVPDLTHAEIALKAQMDLEFPVTTGNIKGILDMMKFPRRNKKKVVVSTPLLDTHSTPPQHELLGLILLRRRVDCLVLSVKDLAETLALWYGMTDKPECLTRVLDACEEGHLDPDSRPL